MMESATPSSDETILVSHYILLTSSILNFVSSISLIAYFAYCRRLKNLVFAIVCLINIGMTIYALNQLVLTALVLQNGQSYINGKCAIHGFFLTFSLSIEYFWLSLLGILVGMALQREATHPKWLKMRYLVPISAIIAAGLATIPVATNSYGDAGGLMMCSVALKGSALRVIQSLVVQILPVVAVVFIAVRTLHLFNQLFNSVGINQYMRQFLYCLMSMPLIILVGSTLYLIRFVLQLNEQVEAAEYTEVIEFCFINIAGVIIAVMYGSFMKSTLYSNFNFNVQQQQSSLTHPTPTHLALSSKNSEPVSADIVHSVRSLPKSNEQSLSSQQNIPTFFASLEETKEFGNQIRPFRGYNSLSPLTLRGMYQSTPVVTRNNSKKFTDSENVANFLFGTMGSATAEVTENFVPTQILPLQQQDYQQYQQSNSLQEHLLNDLGFNKNQLNIKKDDSDKESVFVLVPTNSQNQQTSLNENATQFKDDHMQNEQNPKQN